MKLSKRDIGLLLGLLGIVLAVASYALVFNPMKLKNQELETQLAALKDKEAKLVDLENNFDYYKEQIEVCKEKSEEIIARFPAEVKPENEIMYAVELENALEVEFSTLNYGTPLEIVTDGDKAGVMAYCTSLSGNYRATYKGLKEVILYTADQADRMVVDTVTASYDGTTGNLVGNMTINMYTVAGTHRMYEKPYVPAMNMGITNIFGTIEIPTGENAAGSKGTAKN